MSPLERDRHLLSQILEYCSKIERTVARFGCDQNVFEHDEDYIDSVSMNLLQIGECAGKLSAEFIQDSKPRMDWRAIKNMWNMFAHNYSSMDIDRIWDTAIDDVPELKMFCKEMLHHLESNEIQQNMF